MEAAPVKEVVFLGIGSNLGDRVKNCLKAIEELRAQPGVNVLKTSSLYETEPVGAEGGWFVNCVAMAEVSLGPHQLLTVLQEIEGRMGRPPRRRYGEPRAIDLDILLYGQHEVSTPTLLIPHPEMHKRRFVLLPLSEIAPWARHPVLGLSAKELSLHLQEDPHQVRVLGACPSSPEAS